MMHCYSPDLSHLRGIMPCCSNLRGRSLHNFACERFNDSPLNSVCYMTLQLTSARKTTATETSARLSAYQLTSTRYYSCPLTSARLSASRTTSDWYNSSQLATNLGAVKRIPLTSAWFRASQITSARENASLFTYVRYSASPLIYAYLSAY